MSNNMNPQNHATNRNLSESPPHAEANTPVTWISAAETASLLHLTTRTVLNRAAAGKLPAIVPDDIPFTADGNQNYLIRLESLPQKAQHQYLRSHLPPDQSCALDLTSPRSKFGDAWLSQFIDVSQLIRDAERIRSEYRHTGNVTTELSNLAESNGISLATLYRLFSKISAKELSMLYLDPVYLAPHLPKTMCLWSADFAYALFLDGTKFYSQNSIYRELQEISGTPCSKCPYYQENAASNQPVCHTSIGTIKIPNNRRTVNRLLSHIPPQMICFCREGIRKWRSEFGHFTPREKPLLVNELWQGDHHVFDLFVRITVTRHKNDRTYEKEIAVRPVLTAWMDTATGCLVGWVISILPNADTIAEAFCRAVALTVGAEFHGLPKGILVDCGRDYRSALLEDLPAEYQVGDNLYLNRRFGGLGILPALGVETHTALPYHPQSKSIERLFGTLEREWICKLKGWCHNSVKDRPDGFAKHLKHLLETKELLTLEEFVQKFQTEILPAYHHFREETTTAPSPDWMPSLASMSPLERYHALEKPYLVTPDWQTLSILKMRHTVGCKISRYGIRFQNVWYWDDALYPYMGNTANIFYHAVEKPLAPSSITVTVNGKFVCEAFPAQKLSFTDANPIELQAHLDGQNRHTAEMKYAITRINRLVSAILPEEGTSADHTPNTILPEKAQLRDHSYTVQIVEPAPALSEKVAATTDNTDKTAADACSNRTSQASIQEILSFLFGEK